MCTFPHIELGLIRIFQLKQHQLVDFCPSCVWEMRVNTKMPPEKASHLAFCLAKIIALMKSFYEACSAALCLYWRTVRKLGVRNLSLVAYFCTLHTSITYSFLVLSPEVVVVLRSTGVRSSLDFDEEYLCKQYLYPRAITSRYKLKKED